MTDGDTIDRRIVAGDVDGDGVDVGGDGACFRPKRQGGEGQQAGACSNICNVCEAAIIAGEAKSRTPTSSGRST